jgi:hypothetical protein
LAYPQQVLDELLGLHARVPDISARRLIRVLGVLGSRSVGLALTEHAEQRA